MANETLTTIVGNLTGDPLLAFTKAGVPVARFTVASNARVRDRDSGEWTDGDVLFLPCVAWRRPAENVAQALRKGIRVVVTGRLRQHHHQSANGGQRQTIELEVEDVGVSLRLASVVITRVLPEIAEPPIAKTDAIA